MGARYWGGRGDSTRFTLRIGLLFRTAVGLRNGRSREETAEKHAEPFCVVGVFFKGGLRGLLRGGLFKTFQVGKNDPPASTATVSALLTTGTDKTATPTKSWY